MKTKKIERMRKLLYPVRCPGCDELLSQAQAPQLFCDECIGDIVPIRGRVCFSCGKPLLDSYSDMCRDCETEYDRAGRDDMQILQGRGAFVYTGAMKLAMYRMKYSGRRSYAAPLAEAAYAISGGWLSSLNVDAIIPIPMFREKERARGYNQAEVFATELSKLMSVPVYRDVLQRVRNTIPQKGLDRENRQKNLKNAFKIRQSVVEFKCVLIVDDIYTTGATMREAARTLILAYGCRVFSFCICIGAD